MSLLCVKFELPNEFSFETFIQLVPSASNKCKCTATNVKPF